MTLPAGAIEIGANAYLFRSPSAAPAADCFIIGHGATPKSREYRFTVPQGCTVNFLVPGGQPNFSRGGPILGFKAIAGQNQGSPPKIAVGNCLGEGSSSRDYILGKAVGRHWPGVGYSGGRTI